MALTFCSLCYTIDFYEKIFVFFNLLHEFPPLTEYGIFHSHVYSNFKIKIFKILELKNSLYLNIIYDDTIHYGFQLDHFFSFLYFICSFYQHGYLLK